MMISNNVLFKKICSLFVSVDGTTDHNERLLLIETIERRLMEMLNIIKDMKTDLKEAGPENQDLLK